MHEHAFPRHLDVIEIISASFLSKRDDSGCRTPKRLGFIGLARQHAGPWRSSAGAGKRQRSPFQRLQIRHDHLFVMIDEVLSILVDADRDAPASSSTMRDQVFVCSPQSLPRSACGLMIT
jgi:hypothetical protein